MGLDRVLCAEAGRRVLGEDPPELHIAPQCRHRAMMPGLLHDLELADAVHRRLCDRIRPKTMSRDRPRFQVRSLGGPLQNGSDRVAIEITTTTARKGICASLLNTALLFG